LIPVNGYTGSAGTVVVVAASVVVLASTVVVVASVVVEAGLVVGAAAVVAADWLSLLQAAATRTSSPTTAATRQWFD